jgi:RNA polymerase sigma-70 factor (ECF subfamily)
MAATPTELLPRHNLTRSRQQQRQRPGRLRLECDGSAALRSSRDAHQIRTRQKRTSLRGDYQTKPPPNESDGDISGTPAGPEPNHSMSVTTDPTDSELLDRMASGDREALAIVFRRHHGTVYRFSRQMLGSKEAAEDVTQDVFVALTKSAGRFNPAVASLSTYLYGIARNLVLQRYKRSRARVEVNIDAVAGDDEAAFATISDPTETLAQAHAMQQLRRAILRLPVHYREVVVLCELNGLSYEEAAAIAGCPVGTVRSRLNRARQMLIERCKALLAPERAKSTEPRAQTEGTKRWLIPTKNNC